VIAAPELTAATAQAWLASGLPAMLVRVGATRGSVPREEGVTMLVSADAVAGTIGGGHLEWEAIARARAALAQGHTAPDEWRVSLGPTLGQCCGGALSLHFEPLSAQSLAAWAAPPPRFRLQLYGAGHVGRAIAQACTTLPCTVRWLDERDDEFPAATLPAHIHTVAAQPLEDEVADAQPGDFHLILTHSHALDLALTHAVLQRGDAGWLGLIGSATKRARFEHRLAERGHPPAALAQMVCPIGLAGISGKEPGVIAAAVVAQMLLHSHPY
jgi:xanthine dehydrogenase accessory factor